MREQLGRFENACLFLTEIEPYRTPANDEKLQRISLDDRGQPRRMIRPSCAQLPAAFTQEIHDALLEYRMAQDVVPGAGDYDRCEPGILLL